MSQSAFGCAQNPDGSLRDASEIQFYNDVDDEHPISAAGTSSSTRPLAPIFARGTPVGKVAGSRRPSPRHSSRTSRPSARAIDLSNAEASIGSSKRKAAPENPPTGARKAPRISDSKKVAADSPAADPSANKTPGNHLRLASPHIADFDDDSAARLDLPFLLGSSPPGSTGGERELESTLSLPPAFCRPNIALTPAVPKRAYRPRVGVMKEGGTRGLASPYYITTSNGKKTTRRSKPSFTGPVPPPPMRHLANEGRRGLGL
ncbi:hypothetical protein B0H13DRAFT_1919143 [Mycena leptocephala]|nr:hypothetical protein B0H13DRAFT_1919143 [Mycena leptocephala]